MQIIGDEIGPVEGGPQGAIEELLRDQLEIAERQFTAVEELVRQSGEAPAGAAKAIADATRDAFGSWQTDVSPQPARVEPKAAPPVARSLAEIQQHVGDEDVKQPPGVIDDLLREQIKVAQEQLSVSEDQLRHQDQGGIPFAATTAVAAASSEAGRPPTIKQPESRHPGSDQNAVIAALRERLDAAGAARRPPAAAAREDSNDRPASTLTEHIRRPLSDFADRIKSGISSLLDNLISRVFRQDPGSGGSIQASMGPSAAKPMPDVVDAIKSTIKWWTDSLRLGTRAVVEFTRSMIPIPTTLSGIIKQSVNAANPGVMSTLEKSFQLIIMQLGVYFAPAIMTVAKNLQEFAAHLRGETARPAGQNPGLLTRSAGGLSSLFRNAGDMFGTLVGNGAYGRRREAKEAEEAKLPDIQAKNSRADLENYERLNEGGRTTFNEILGRQLREFKDKAVAGTLHDKENEGLAKRVEEAMSKAIEAHGQFAKKDRTAASGKPSEKGDEKPGSGTAGGKGGSTFKHDMLPPGYQAQFTAIEDVRRQAQMKALNVTPLDQKMYEEQVKFFNAMMEAIKGMGGKQEVPALPRRD